MSDPSAEQVRVSIAAFRGEAAVWDGIADQALAAHGTAANLQLTAFHFSALGHMAGADALYTLLQQRLADLLAQAMTNFNNTAQALRGAADGYEHDETTTVHRMKHIY